MATIITNKKIKKGFNSKKTVVTGMDRLKQQIINIGRAMLDIGWQNTHGGNISARDGDSLRDILSFDVK